MSSTTPWSRPPAHALSPETSAPGSDGTSIEPPAASGAVSERQAGGATPPQSEAGTAPAPLPVDAAVLAAVASGAHHNPHSVLGAHRHHEAGGAPAKGVTVRALRPFALSVTVVTQDGLRVPMRHEHDGIWVTAIEHETAFDYRLDVEYEGADGPREERHDDAYRFLPTLGEVDLHLIGEGRHERLWEVLGARVQRSEGPMGKVEGTAFAVWAPNARAVRIVGDLNGWDGRSHAMRSLGASGVWELYVPDAVAGTCYKYEILGRDGVWRQKADPMAFATEIPPATASVVTETRHVWGDGEWMAARAATNPHAGPISIYEVHLGSWRQGLSYRQLAEELVEYVRELGFTHIELMPVAEHPFSGSWGYQVTGYYAPTSRFGSPDDFRYFVDRFHQAGIGVIVDWVPAHFPKDEWALARFDGEPLYEHGDARRAEHPDWGTLVFDYGRREVRNFLVANALYWLEELHIDGLRVDAVASMLYLDYSRAEGQWTPNEHGGREDLQAIAFLQEVNATSYGRVPGTMIIAEESTAWPGVTRPTHVGGLGFGLKWNMGWMHDSLGYMSKEPVYRQYHHHEMTFSMMYAFSENFVLPLSHDEVVHGKGSLLRKMPGDRWQQLANLRAYLAFMWAHPGKQLLFMGSELGQEPEWSESRSLDWWLLETPWHRGVHDLVRDLNHVYREQKAMWADDFTPGGFEWIDANDTAHNVFAWLRKAPGQPTVVSVSNFAGVPHNEHRIGLPHGGRWREVLNTDSHLYGGSGVGNLGVLTAEAAPMHGRPYSVRMAVPPLATVWLVAEDVPDPALTVQAQAALGRPGEAAPQPSPVAQVAEPARPEEANRTPGGV